MPELYFVITLLLFFLAISDLIIGVSNDAVNFLNSAIGSKVAPRHLIMIVASIGIFVGAAFSSGMMEVARKGIFNPEYFFFGEIMIIFLAVMLTDIILLDFFNTIGMPTSTTVSIVFELLGAAVVMSLIKITANGESLDAMANYINSSKAIMIVGGIFLSVIFAFLIGVIVQYFSRLLFTFQYDQKRKRVSSVIWTALSMTAMTYFLLFKGLKGASFVTNDIINWVQDQMLILLFISFLIWSGVMYLLVARKVNVFRIVVLFGTFALAMAFAGNDLVNFIGVPIAGFESYNAWNASGQDAFKYSMEILQEPVRTKSYLLVIAGIIMIVTLWFSRKARSVTDTEVSLGRQSEGHERFNPNLLSRVIVRFSLGLGKLGKGLMPFDKVEETGQTFKQVLTEDTGKPAFDLVRAGVNLTTASVLIAFATSLKLPLSTTYVSFMVAMGTSLADRAWGRDSAVYRVAGVLNVIGGWFATALIAFAVSGTFAFLIYNFQLAAIIFLVIMAIYFIYRSFAYHKVKDKKKQARISFENRNEEINYENLLNNLSHRISDMLKTLSAAYDKSIMGLTGENERLLSDAITSVESLVEKNEDFQYELVLSVKRIRETKSEGSRIFLYVYDLEQDIVQSMELITGSIDRHLKNMLNPLKDSQKELLKIINLKVGDFLENVNEYILKKEHHKDSELNLQKKELFQTLENALANQIRGIKDGSFGARNSQLVFKILFESKDIVAVASRFVKLYQRAYDAAQDKGYFSFSMDKRY